VPLSALAHGNSGAGRGFIFRARDGNSADTAGGFGWLTWDGDTNEQALLASLYPPPGNFFVMYPGSRADTNTIPNFNPAGGSGDADGVLEIGEWVEGSTGNIAAADGALAYYVDNTDAVTLIVYDDYTASGSNAVYHVIGFVKAKLLAFELGTNDKWVVIEFLGWGEECQSLASGS
jgi:hypothetical protein